MIPAAIPAPTQQPMHLASADLGVAITAVAILATAITAVIVLRMGISSMVGLAGCHSAHEGNLNATCEQPRPIVPSVGTPLRSPIEDEISSRKYGRAAADAFSEPRCGMRCPDKPQLEQDDGHEQDGDTGEIAPALYQQLGVRGLARRELCRHSGHLPHSSDSGKGRELRP